MSRDHGEMWREEAAALLASVALAKATGISFGPMSTLQYCTNCGRQVVPADARKCAVCDAPVLESPHAPTVGIVAEKKTSAAAGFDKDTAIAVRVVVVIVVGIASA